MFILYPNIYLNGGIISFSSKITLKTEAALTYCGHTCNFDSRAVLEISYLILTIIL